VAKASAVTIHQFLSTAGLLLLAIHIGGVLLDTFVRSTVLDVLVPLHSSFRPWAVAAGTLALYASVVVLASSWTRKYMSNRIWRNLHYLAVPAFALALLHGVFTGTDTTRPWMYWTYLVTGGVIVFLVLVRVQAARTGNDLRPAVATPTRTPPSRPDLKDDRNESWLFSESKR
jgi:predicted ferric reductase